MPYFSGLENGYKCYSLCILITVYARAQHGPGMWRAVYCKQKREKRVRGLKWRGGAGQGESQKLVERIQAGVPPLHTHTPCKHRKDYMRTQWEGSCLQVRKAGLTHVKGGIKWGCLGQGVFQWSWEDIKEVGLIHVLTRWEMRVIEGTNGVQRVKERELRYRMVRSEEEGVGKRGGREIWQLR